MAFLGRFFCIMGSSLKNFCPTLVLKEPIRILIIGKGREQNIDVCLVGILSAALEKDLVKLENPERTSEGVQRDGTTSVQDCKLNDSLGKLCQSGRALQGRNQRCTGLGADEMIRQNFQSDGRKILAFSMQNVIMLEMRLVGDTVENKVISMFKKRLDTFSEVRMILGTVVWM